MMRSIRIFCLGLFIFSISQARPLTEVQKESDFLELVGQIRAGYGPLEFKRTLGIDLDRLVAQYQNKIKATQTNEQFNYLLVQFIAEFKDSHFGGSVPTELSSKLGFSVDWIENRLLIDQIDRKILSETVFPFEKGDEVISVDGKTPAEWIREFEPFMGQGNDRAAKRRAAWLIPHRRGVRIPIARGKAVVAVQKQPGNQVQNEIQTVTLEWKVSGARLDLKRANASLRGPGQDVLNYDQIALDFLKSEESFRCSGNTRIQIPSDAVIISREPFVAYYHPTSSGNVGYLRIPHYSPEEADPRVDALELRFRQYEYAVSVLEQNTVGLVIDQDHNCGGSVAWLHRFLSLFMDRAFKPMQFELLASKASYLSFDQWVRNANPLTIAFQNSLRVRNLIENTWLQGSSFLTPKTSIDGTDWVAPHTNRYTKPIVVLIDELSGSGGDAFPALIGGYGRAKLIGSQTMGAGGHVVSLPPLSHSQLQVRITKSLFFRPDGVPVENHGAVPHPGFEYIPTAKDFRDGYLDYQKFYLARLQSLISE